MTKTRNEQAMNFSGITWIAAFLLVIILIPEALLNYDWNDWWESLAIRLSAGQTIYTDQDYFSGPLYPGLIKLFIEHAGLSAGAAVKATGCIGLAILGASLVAPLGIAQQEWNKAIGLITRNSMNRRLRKYCSSLTACIMAVGGTVYLFSSFLRVDDYHIFRMAGFNLVLAASYQLLYKREEIKIPLSVISGAGIGLVMAARLHEGIALLVLCSSVIFAASKDKMTAAVFCINTLAVSGLITAVTGGWLAGLSDAKELNGFISATVDSAKAKTGTGIGVLLERAKDLTFMSAGMSLEFAKKILKAFLFVGISLFAWEALARPAAVKKPFNKRVIRVKLLGKKIHLTRRRIYLYILSIVAIFILHDIFLHYRMAYVLLLGSCVCMTLLTLRNSEFRCPSCNEYIERFMFSAAMCATPIIAGLASSSMRIEIDYGMAYLYFYSPLAICSLANTSMENRNVLFHSLRSNKWHHITHQVYRDAISTAIISLLCISIYSMVAIIGVRLLNRWKWWGSGPIQSLPQQIYAYAFKDNTRDRTIESRLLNDKLFWSIDALPKSFFSEIIELCSYFEDVSSGKPVTVWSYPSPMPSVGCSNTKIENSSRYTLWYDVTGNKSALKELELLQSFMPDSIIIYDIAGAYEAHANTFGGYDSDSSMAIISQGVEGLIERSYIRTRIIKTRYGRLYVYLRRDLPITIKRLPIIANPTAKIRL